MFEALIGQIITNVKVIPFNNFERIEFWFGNDVLKLSVDNDTDEIIFSYLKSVKYKKIVIRTRIGLLGWEKKS